MSWHPQDLVTDDDLVAYERTIFTQFDQTAWTERRQKALDDWLFPLLEGQGFAPHRLRTRFEPTTVLGYTSSAFTDLTSAAATSEGLTLSSVLASANDALYVGSVLPFRGLSVRMLDAVNTVASTVTVQAWADGWESVTLGETGTQVGAVPFAKGGTLTWANPDGVALRTLSTATAAYWVRIALSVAPTTGTKIGPLFVVRRSRLCAAAALRTLALIFREAPMAQDGPWTEKAVWYEAQADAAWLRVVGTIGGEFDTDGSDAIDQSEEGQTSLAVTGGGWTMDRA